jgi:hypothetical protein
MFWVTYDTILKFCTKKVLISSFILIVVLVFLPLAMTNYLTYSEPMRDLYKDIIFEDFLAIIYLFSQMLLTSYIIILSAITGGEVFLGESEQIYLTGGVNKIKYFVGRILGIVLFISMIWWTLFLLTGFTLLITKTSYVEFYILNTFIKLCFNSILLALLSIFLVGLFKVLVIGFIPILLAQYWQYINLNAYLELKDDRILNIVNYILPINSYKLLSITEERMNILYKYQELSPFHGNIYMYSYTAILLIIMIYIYTKAEF